MRKIFGALILSAGLVFTLGAAKAFADSTQTGDTLDGFDGTGDLTAIPEPTAAAVMGIGFAAIAYAHRLRRR